MSLYHCFFMLDSKTSAAALKHFSFILRSFSCNILKHLAFILRSFSCAMCKACLKSASDDCLRCSANTCTRRSSIFAVRFSTRSSRLFCPSITLDTFPLGVITLSLFFVSKSFVTAVDHAERTASWRQPGHGGTWSSSILASRAARNMWMTIPFFGPRSFSCH